MKYFTQIGTYEQISRIERNLRMNNKEVEVVEFKCIGDGMFLGAWKYKEYTPDEQQDIEVYGDPAHEDYLLSDDYESDCQMEKWDWLKNEMS